MDTVDVIIPTYGDFERWRPLAERAVASVRNQTYPVNAIWCQHLEGSISLPLVRNATAENSRADRLIFLDADDELDPYYVEEMLKGYGDIRQPSTLGIVNGQEDKESVLIRPNPGGFLVGNHLVIGSMIRRADFLAVGGFRDLPILEDWDLFIRLQINGAKVGTCPKAVYRVHVQPSSRNKNPRLHAQIYADIQERYRFDWALKGFK